MPEGTEGEQVVRVLPAWRALRGQERTEGRGMEGMRLRGQGADRGTGMEGTSLLMEDGKLVMSLSLGDLAWLPLPPLNLGPPSPVLGGSCLGDFPKRPCLHQSVPQTQGKAKTKAEGEVA